MGSRRRSSGQSGIQSKLTSRQQFWLKHLRACDASGENIKECASRKGLSAHGLCGARKRMRTLDVPPTPERAKKRTPFAKVLVREDPVELGRCRVRLPNGTVMEWDVPLAARSLELLFQAMARLS